MNKFIVATLLFLTSPTVIAGQGIIAKYGLGLGAPDQSSIAENKFISLGYQSHFNGSYSSIFDYKYEFGVWSDVSHKAGRKSNGFLSASVGLEPDLGWLYLNSFFGLAAVATTDSTMGSVPEFVEDIGAGFQDNKKRRMGVGYKHFSNAGIWAPNKGRDFITITLQIPL